MESSEGFENGIESIKLETFGSVGHAEAAQAKVLHGNEIGPRGKDLGHPVEHGGVRRTLQLVQSRPDIRVECHLVAKQELALVGLPHLFRLGKNLVDDVLLPRSPLSSLPV